MCFYSQKRITPITYEGGEKGAGGKKFNRGDRSLHSPPSGKFSERAGTYPTGKLTN